MSPNQNARFLPWLISGVLVPPAISVLLVAWLRPSDASWSFAGVIAVASLIISLLSTYASRRWIGAFVAFAISALLLLWPEVGLRVAGYQLDQRAVVQFGWPKPDVLMRMDEDPELFWKLPAGRRDVNSHGFIGRDFVIPKPDDVWRIVFLGDSCTHQGFPKPVAAGMNRQSLTETRFEAINLGVPGYTSHQGRIVADRWIEKLDPDLGVVYFGWNDHWLAYGAIDSERAQLGQFWQTRLGQSRLVQFTSRLMVRQAKPLSSPRVPIDEYRKNLEAIGDRIEAAGSDVLFITAPSAHERRGFPDGLVKQGFAANKEQPVEWHRQYNDVVRDVAQRRNWFLLDLEREVQTLPNLDNIFILDGIHYKPEEGMIWIARRIAREIREKVLKP